MSDGYLIALVRDGSRLAPSDELPDGQDDKQSDLLTGTVLSERLTQYLTYDADGPGPLPVTPPPLSLQIPRDEDSVPTRPLDPFLLQPPTLSSSSSTVSLQPKSGNDAWWRQSWPDSVTETAARSSEDDEDEDDELFFYQEDHSPPTFPTNKPEEPPVAAPPPRIETRLCSSNRVLPTTQNLTRQVFHGAAELRQLANAIYLLSRWFCPWCSGGTWASTQSDHEDSVVSEETEARVSRLDWSSLDREPSSPPTVSVGGDMRQQMTLGTALPLVLSFVAWLQSLEAQRHASESKRPAFAGSFWTLCAALTFQNGLQAKVHLAESEEAPRKRARAACGLGCCQCPGFAAVDDLALRQRTSEAPPLRRRAALVSSICSRLLLQSGAVEKGALSTNNNPHVMQRDCSAALEIIQRFSVALFIGSAWVEEQEPISTGVISGFLSKAFGSFVLEGKCRRWSSSSPVLTSLAARGTQLRRIAAATATTLYLSIVPCVPASASPQHSVSCSICQLDSQPASAPTIQRSLGATHRDFECKLCSVIDFADSDLRLVGGELDRVADAALKILNMAVPSIVTTASGESDEDGSSY